MTDEPRVHEPLRLRLGGHAAAEDEVVDATIDHGRRIHNMEATRDQVLAVLHAAPATGRRTGRRPAAPRDAVGPSPTRPTSRSSELLAAQRPLSRGRGRPARARRAAVHRHPPGLRAVVQAAPPRADRGPADARGRRHGHDPPPPEPGPEDPQDARRPDRRPRDDDPAPVHRPSATGSSRRPGSSPAQFREVEAVLGRRDASAPAAHPEGSAGRARIEAAQRRRSLWGSFLRVPRRARPRACGRRARARRHPPAGAGRAGPGRPRRASIAATPTRRSSPNGSSTSTRASRSGATAT